jgi:SSS family solute:Na+ symporter
MNVVDWAIIVMYLSAMLGVGFYYANRTSSEEDYLLGGRNMGIVSVGLSMFASLLSTVSYLAVPGEMIKHGPMMLAEPLVYPVVFGVVGYLLIPLIMKQPVVTAYEILEHRFGLGIRLFGSALFLVLRFIWMAVILYVTIEKIFVPLIHLPEWSAPYAGVAFGLITVTYTSMGGLRAVVVTDAIQSLILLGGAVLTLIVITLSLGGVSQWWPTTWAGHWDPFEFMPRPGVRVTLGGAMLASVTWWICTCGSDQIVVQRYLATRNARSARLAMGVSLVTGLLATALLGAVGLALLAYFRAHADMLPSDLAVNRDADRLFPFFITTGFPHGITGLVIAGLLAAAMSTFSSGITATCSVISSDFMDRLFPTHRGSASTRRTKIISWSIGIVSLLLSSLVGCIEGNLVELCYKATNLLVVPLFMLFFMAMFVPRATAFGAVVAVVVSTIVAVGIAYFDWFGLSFVWIMPASFLAGAIAGPLASLLSMPRGAQT